VSDALAVSLNRDRLHDVEVAERYATDGPFVVEFSNHGESMHVHLHLDDELSTVAELEANNHYVEEGATVAVQVGVNPRSEPVTGKLKIVTGYGAETTYVDVRVEERERGSTGGSVDVDESLARPQRRQPGSNGSGGGGLSELRSAYGDTTLAVAGAGVALLFALVGVGVVVDGALVLVAVGMVVGALLVTAALMAR
jgi:hypothetical protein